jgi:hypothetical protein
MRNFLACLPLALLLACASSRVAVDSDPGYDFTTARTFAWHEGVPAESELQERRIVAAVEQELTARGLQRAEQDAADLWIVSEAGSRREVRSSGTSLSIGASRGTGWGGVGVGTTTGNRVYEVDVGQLVLTVVDASEQRVVWRATAEETLSEDPEKTARFIQEAVAEAFAEFPLPRLDG